MLFFRNTELGKVAVEFYGKSSDAEMQMLLEGTDFELKDPTQTGALDNMVSAHYLDFYGNFIYRMAGFFVAPISGNHIFTVACHYWCRVYFDHGPNVNRTSHKIIELNKYTHRLRFNQ